MKNPGQNGGTGRQPQTIAAGKARGKLQPKNSAGSGATWAAGIFQQQDRRRRREICRTAATACRTAAPKGFMRAVSGLYQVYLRPPYSPPKADARGQRQPCKITSQHSRTAGQTAGQAPTAASHQHRPPADHSQQASAQQATANTAQQTTASHHRPQPPAIQVRRAAPMPGPGAARATGPEGVGTPAGVVRSAGSGAQNFFRCEGDFSLPPGGAGKKRGPTKNEGREEEGRALGRWSGAGRRRTVTDGGGRGAKKIFKSGQLWQVFRDIVVA